MYARYIPPPRGDTTISNTEPIVSPQAPQIPPKAQPTAYARYVPPPKTQPQTSAPAPVSAPGSQHIASPQHVRFNDVDLNGDEPPSKRVKLAQEDVATPVSDKGKPKKLKKAKRKSIQQQDETTNDIDIVNGDVADEPREEIAGRRETVNQSEDVDMLPAAGASSTQSEQASVEETAKQREKSKKRKPRDGDTAAPIEDNIPLRYKAILEKKAKSMQKPPEPKSKDVVMDNGLHNIDDDVSREKSPEIKLHGLEPIPQPKPLELDTSTPSYETLPPWLAAPIRISQDASALFTDLGLLPDLGISSEIAKRLAAKGYEQAFAIQTGVIPLLLPHHCKRMQGDVLVSAATGSGKTLAYTLPMIRDISQSNRHSTRLRALIVLPTRELVKQVQQVCEDCAGVFSLDGAKRRPRIAMAMGSQSFGHEQTLLIDREEVYKPEAYKKRMGRLARRNGLESDNDGHELDEDLGYNTEDEERDAIHRREDKMQTLPDHVIAYKSKVDILICTPGRLVEHIKFTPGFSLDYVRWLIVDEADKLLGQTFQQWLDVVIPRLQSNNHIGARNHKQSNLSGVRKVILSATMTRDLDQLAGLKLRRPKLVVLEGSKLQDEVGANQTEHVLPELLEETALKVGDPNLKPLFLVDLLRSHYMLSIPDESDGNGDDDDDTSSSGSNTDSDSDSHLTSESETKSDSEPESESKSKGPKKAVKPFQAATKTQAKLPAMLIFTKSNETALRLSRLLALLAPTLGPLIGILTSTTPYTSRRDTFRSFNAGKLRIIVASDLIARGIDLPSLDHVINYDMPSSIASYIHRVGRTARAGNAGKAWTLFTNAEARWFWNEVASEKVIQRSKPVERVRITEEKEKAFNDKVVAYEKALERLGREAGQARRKSRKE